MFSITSRIIFCTQKTGENAKPEVTGRAKEVQMSNSYAVTQKVMVCINMSARRSQKIVEKILITHLMAAGALLWW